MNRYVANGSFGSRLCENAQPTQFRGTFDYSFLKRIEYGASWQVDFFAKEIFSSFHTASVVNRPLGLRALTGHKLPVTVTSEFLDAGPYIIAS